MSGIWIIEIVLAAICGSIAFGAGMWVGWRFARTNEMLRRLERNDAVNTAADQDDDSNGGARILQWRQREK